MEKKQDESKLINVAHPSGGTSTDAKLKAELTLLQRKFTRLEQKEKCLQVTKILFDYSRKEFLRSLESLSRLGTSS